MTRKLILASAIATALTGHPALALELGALHTESALNQPFRGEIDLGDIEPDAFDTLHVSIASPEAFEKAGLERYYHLTELRFMPEVTADGRLRVRVSSRDPVREPYLDFLVEAVWSTGRLVKSYTVLLDPPAQTERRAPNVNAARVGTTASGPDRGLPPIASGSGTYIPAPGEGFPLYIGPVGGGEGLWSLARRHTTAGATDAQIAMALYRCNQGAFVRGDIDRLIAGKTLVIPSRAELFALDAEEARRELQAAVNGRPAQRAPITDVSPEALSRLRLVGAAPGTGTPVAPMPQPGVAPSTRTSGVQSPDVLLAIETSETARQETIELRNRIKELETQLADIQSLLQVRNTELARAQAVESQRPALASESPGSEPEPESRVVLEPIESPGALLQEPVEVPEPKESGSTIGLVPIPTPTPVTPETPATTATPDSPTPVEPAPKVVTAKEPASVTAPNESAPMPESSSTWHALLLPLAGLAGVTALGILLFSLLTVRRRRQEQESPQDDVESDLVLDRLSELEPEPSAASLAAKPAAAVSLTKAASIHRPQVETAPAPAIPDLDDTSELAMSGLTGFDAETDESDVLSEADVYIAYGRHREACDLLNKELKRYPQRLDIKYKLAEALAASSEAEALRDLLDDIRISGGDSQEPAQWKQMQRVLQELTLVAPATPSPTALAVATAGLGLAGSAVSASLESVAVPVLESVVALEPQPESEEELLLDLGDSLPLEFADATDATPSADVLNLELDAGSMVPPVEEIAQAIEGDIDSILPLPEESDGLDLDLGIFDAIPVPARTTPVAAESQADDRILDLDLEVPLDENFDDLDLSIDGLGLPDETHKPPESTLFAGEPEPSPKTVESLETLESGPSPEQESLPSDLLSSQWQIDSSIWDETATKLDLARAYVEMDDREAAREILEEVLAEGREEQRREARSMLQRLG